MIDYPNCKINIGLNIIGKRRDGYHDIESIFYPVKNYTDALEIIPASKFSLEIYGNKVNCKTKDNIIFKAYDLIRRNYKIPGVSIFLFKNIPEGSGLGGGSSDGVFTLILLNKIFELGISGDKILLLSLQLGSDCPFFIINEPRFVKGRGEIMQPCNIDLKGYQLIIITPDIAVSTKEAYQNIIPVLSENHPDKIITKPLVEWKKFITNDFENYLSDKFPEIISIKKALYEIGALYASVSGSGSSVYGISDKELSTGDLPLNYHAWKGII